MDVVRPRQLERPVTRETRWVKGLTMDDGSIEIAVATPRETIGPWDHGIIWNDGNTAPNLHGFTLWDGELVWDGAPTRAQLENVPASFRKAGLGDVPSRHLYGGAITLQCG